MKIRQSALISIIALFYNSGGVQSFHTISLLLQRQSTPIDTNIYSSSSSIEAQTTQTTQQRIMNKSDKQLQQDIAKFASSGRVEEAQALLEQMESMYYTNSNGAATKIKDGTSVIIAAAPNVYSYAKVLHAWAKRSAVTKGKTVEDMSYCAKRAEGILARMIELSSPSIISAHKNNNANNNNNNIESSSPTILPNRVCFNSCMAAWANCGVRGQYAAKKTEKLLRQMEQLYNITGDINIKPDIVSYGTVINAWAQSGAGRLAAQKAEAVLNKMVRLYEEDVVRANANANNGSNNKHATDGSSAKLVSQPFQNKPSIVAYNTVIKAWARSNTGKLGARRAQALLNRMGERYRDGTDKDLKPDLRTWNTVITAWAKSGEKFAGKEAENVLRRMNEFYIAENETHLLPDIMAYNSVLDAWSKSRASGAPQRAQAILDHLEVLAVKKPSLKLDRRTYSTVINAYAKSSEFKKAHNAVSILNRMEPAGVTPDVFTYTAVINACAFSHRKEKSYDIALEILQRMREPNSEAAPNSITYKTILQACTNLFQHNSPKRDKEVERTFEWCKEDGMCCDMVLLQLKRAASQSLLPQLVGYDVANLEFITIVDVPSEWSRNIDRRLIQR